MLLEIITPETQIFKGQVEAVQLPGLDGSFQVLNGHAPIISALKRGEVKVNLAAAFEGEEFTSSLIQADKSNAKVIRVEIQGGVFEMLNNKITLLAE